MCQKDSTKIVFPEFPRGEIGLQRGSILIALCDVPKFRIKKFDSIVLGFDGKLIRCAGFTWKNIQGIEDEINSGIWKISNEIINLDDPARAKIFAQSIELRNF